MTRRSAASASSSTVEAHKRVVSRRTFRLELWRALPTGVLETVVTTFALLIAVKHYEAGTSLKALLRSSPSLGLVASLFLIPPLLRLPWGLPRVAALLHFTGALGFLLAVVLSGSVIGFVAGMSLGLFSYALQVPLLTQIYNDNYPPHDRGRLFSLTTLARAGTAMAFSYAGGRLLGYQMDWFPAILAAFAISGCISAMLIGRIPGKRPSRRRRNLRRPPLTSMRWVKRDPAFRRLLTSWMVLGLGNLMAMAVYVDYLADPFYGQVQTAATIALLTGVVPLAGKLLFIYHWGRWFDRLSFYKVRVVLNSLIAAAILLFFIADSLWLKGLGMFLHGIALGGGNIAWSLWVTKFAPSRRVTEYMTVHTFLTGLRGAIAPFMGLYLVRLMPVPAFAILCAAMSIGGSMIIAGKISRRKGRDGDSPTPPGQPAEPAG